MLLTREEMRFDFQGARFDLGRTEDRRFLGWVFNQFLYGEVTGIQCGYWLYRAPSLHAAAFLAKQAQEELSHVKRIVRILELLREAPAPAHAAIRFLSTGMMGSNWGEHVTLEMALGEGLVLSVFYAMAETVGDPEIEKIVRSALEEEEKHVDFGEREAKAWLEAHPRDREMLFASASVQLIVLRILKRFVLKSIRRSLGERHPVMQRFEPFYDQVVRCFEVRMRRLGIWQERGWIALVKLPWIKALRKSFELLRGSPLLTDTYLQDPVVRGRHVPPQ